MKRPVKYLLATAVIICLLAVILAASGYSLSRAAPAFYHRHVLSVEQQAAIAESTENKIAETRNWLARTHAQESARVAGRQPSTASTAPSSVTLTLSADELNAFFDKWSQTFGWSDKYASYLTDPAIFLADDHLILAGTIKDLNSVLSLHFRTHLDPADGQLGLDLDQVLAGRLPLPESLFSQKKQRLESALESRLPGWQQNAQMQPNGTSNNAAVAASSAKLALAALNHQPIDPAIFLPLQTSKFIPVKLTAVAIRDNRITFTAIPLTAADRASLLRRIREPSGMASANAASD